MHFLELRNIRFLKLDIVALLSGTVVEDSKLGLWHTMEKLKFPKDITIVYSQYRNQFLGLDWIYQYKVHKKKLSVAVIFYGINDWS